MGFLSSIPFMAMGNSVLGVTVSILLAWRMAAGPKTN